MSADTPLTLVVMAAGMGSRYGGLKQVEGFGPHGETLLEYSLFDAKRAGFERVVFVIRRDIEELFKEQVVSRFESAFDIAYAFQSLEDLPGGRTPPEGRTKPWGTGQAVLAAREQVPGAFAVINADDYYGQESFGLLADALRSEGEAHLLMAFRLDKTLSEHGTVSRGVCQVDAQKQLTSVEEVEALKPDGVGGAVDAQERSYTGSEPVSMNLWGFRASFFNWLGSQFEAFLEEKGGKLKAEYYLPYAVSTGIDAGNHQIEVLQSPAQWYGVTYPEDKEHVQAALNKLVTGGAYPDRLW